MFLYAPKSYSAIEPGNEQHSGISKYPAMVEAVKMQQALAATLKLMETTIAATGKELVCLQHTQPTNFSRALGTFPGTEQVDITLNDLAVEQVDNTMNDLAAEQVTAVVELEHNNSTQELPDTSFGTPVTVSGVGRLDICTTEITVEQFPSLGEQNRVHNIAPNDLLLGMNLGVLGVNLEVQSATIEAEQVTTTNVQGEDMIVEPIERVVDHSATMAREVGSTPIPTPEGAHGRATDSSASTTHSQSIEEFLESISIPIQQPPATGAPPTPQGTSPTIGRKNRRGTESSIQRKSTRLAEKAELNVGKDAVQVAHDLLVKKLGEGDDTNTDEPDYEFYAQHFERPIELSKMEAIQELIEQGSKKKKKGSTTGRRTAEVGLDA